MEHRKLIKTGAGSVLSITLPAAFRVSNNLSKGDEVEVHIKGDTLIIKAIKHGDDENEHE